MQNTIVIGYLGRDAEEREIGGKRYICFPVGDKYKDKTTWISCRYEIKRENNLKNYLTKGKEVYIRGRISASPYLNKEGKPSCSIDLFVFEIELLGGMQSQEQAQQTAPKAVAPTGDLPF